MLFETENQTTIGDFTPLLTKSKTMLSKKVEQVSHKIGTQTSTNEKTEFETFIEKWQSLSCQEVPNLFYAHPLTEQYAQRLMTYEIKGTDLTNLLAPNDLRIRIHLGADSDFNPSQINVNAPFIPIIQGFDAATPPSNPDTNAFRMTWVPFVSTQSQNASMEAGNKVGDVHINHQAASQFIDNWLFLPFSDLQKQFDISTPPLLKRVRYYTYNTTDGTEIKNYKNQFGNNAVLFMHLGCFQSHTPEVDPFNFCPILEIAEVDPVTKIKANSQYYEFASPCPPAC